MSAFRTLLSIIILTVGAYTAVVVADHGLTLYPVFFGDIAAMAWPGQFNLDFLCMLALSGLWVSWRNAFSPAGLMLGFGALMLGAPFLAVYLLVLSFSTDGDLRLMLLGPTRV